MKRFSLLMSVLLALMWAVLSGAQSATGLIPAGKPAPDFTLPTIEKKQVALNALTKSNKAVIVNFWGYYCGPCREELPHLNALLMKYKAKGLAVVAISQDEKEDYPLIVDYWKKNKFAIVSAVDGESVYKAYKVVGTPTNYVIGKEGKVLAAFEGFDEKGILKALAKAGIKVK
jgi:peroxiredoxin